MRWHVIPAQGELNLHHRRSRNDGKLKHDCSTPPWSTRNDNTANTRLNEQNSKRATRLFKKKNLCNDRALSTYLEEGCERAGSARRYLSSLVRLVKHHSSTYIYRFIRYPYLSRTLRGSYIATGLLSVHRRSLPDRFVSKHALSISHFTVFSFRLYHFSIVILTYRHVANCLCSLSQYICSPSHFSFFSRSIVSRSYPISMRAHAPRHACPSVSRLYGDNKETSQKLFRRHQRQIVCIFS